MRDYSKVGPRFWTGETGRYLRLLGRDAQVIGFYLFTCPTANMIGLYYLPLSTLTHETGIEISTAEIVLERIAEAPSEPLTSPFEGVFARYDRHTETVFVTEMARHQIGERLSKKDNRHKAVTKELENYRKTPFFNDFLDRYSEPFELREVARNKPLPSPSGAPSKPRAGSGAGTEHTQSGFGPSAFSDGGQGAEGKPPEGPIEAWRDVDRCDVQAHETWLAYRAEAGDTVPSHTRLVNAKFLAGKGSPEAQRAFIDEIIRLQFKRMHNPVHGNGGDGKPAKEGRTHAGLPIVNP